MKKTLALLLALILCMTAFGCSSVQSVSNDKQNSPAPTDEVTNNPSVTEEPTFTSAPTPTAVPTPVPTPTPIPTLAPEPTPTYDYEQMIRDLFAHINEGDYIGYASAFAPVTRYENLSMVNRSNRDSKKYVFNFKHIDVLEISKVNDRYFRPSQGYLPKLDEILLDTDDFDCYHVRVSFDLYEPLLMFPENDDEDEPFSIDTPKYELDLTVTTVKEGEKWFVATVQNYDPVNRLDPSWIEYIDKFYLNLNN